MGDLTIGILETGPVAESLRTRHGDYPAMFRRFLEGRGFAFRTWKVTDWSPELQKRASSQQRTTSNTEEGAIPDAPDICDGWLVTGSRHGAYEDHPWIPPLEEFLRSVHAQKIPLVGICFGHQIIAQALGGKTVKFPDGWGVGRTSYALEGFSHPVNLYAMHQDQVIEAPPGARVAGCSDFCAIAALEYGPHAWSLQPHPEFTADYFAELVEYRENMLPDDKAALAMKTFREPCDNALMAAKIESVLKSRQKLPVQTA